MDGGMVLGAMVVRETGRGDGSGCDDNGGDCDSGEACALYGNVGADEKPRCWDADQGGWLSAEPTACGEWVLGLWCRSGDGVTVTNLVSAQTSLLASESCAVEASMTNAPFWSPLTMRYVRPSPPRFMASMSVAGFAWPSKEQTEQRVPPSGAPLTATCPK